MLSRLVLDNFRNYAHDDIHFAPGITFLLGENGQGKTNVLEAIYFLSLLRSFRTTQLGQLSTVGSSMFSLYGEVTGIQGELTRLGLQYGGMQQRQLRVNGTPVGRSSDFISHLVCSAFIPEDLEIVKGSPGARRRFINVALCQKMNSYLHDLQGYNEALRSRNLMLRQIGKYSRETVTAYDTVLVDYACRVEMARRELGEQLNRTLELQSELFFPDGRKLGVQYLSGCHTLLEAVPDSMDILRERYQAALLRSYEHDCREGSTRFGCHRSELSCLINGKILGYYGSEGECRTAALALRFAVSNILRDCRGQDAMITIVDDVIGELDENRRRAFIDQLFESGQVVFAGTAVPSELVGKCSVLGVRGGKIVYADGT